MNGEISMSTPDTQEQNVPTESKCPVAHSPRKFQRNADWCPNQVDLRILHQHSPLSNPMGKDFNYVEEFKTLHLNAVAEDLHALMTASKPSCPTDCAP